jgi:hypothetical protein
MAENAPKYSASKNANTFDAKPDTNTFFQGRTNSDAIDRDPLVSGYAFIYWLKIPTWLEQLVPNFRELTQKNLRSFGGIADIELSTFSIQEGFTASEALFAANSQMFQGFTMNHREWSGSPIRHAYGNWTTGIRDPKTGICRYARDFKLKYGAKNHTGELLYIVTRPDADNTSGEGGSVIEFACKYDMVLPLKNPLAHFNFTSGTVDGTELEMPFAGIPNISEDVNRLANEVHKNNLFVAGAGTQFQTMNEYKVIGR